MESIISLPFFDSALVWIITIPPGFCLSRWLSDRFKLGLTSAENVVLGFVLWTFVVVSSSLLLAFLPPLAYVNFLILTSIALFLVTYFFKEAWMFFSIRLHREKSFLVGFVVLVPIAITLILLGTFHSIFYEYDAYFFYLPMTKVLTTTGGLINDPWHLSQLGLTFPPAIPILYGLSSWQGDSSAIRQLPLIFLLMTCVSTYLLARETYDERRAQSAASILVTMPLIVAAVSSFSLYLDLGFTFFLVSLAWIVVKIMKTPTLPWFFFLGVVSCMVLLTKELAPFMVPSILAPILIGVNFRSKLLAVAMATSPFAALLVFDTMRGTNLALVGYRVVPVAALALVTIGCSLVFLKNGPTPLVDLRRIGVFLIGLVPFAIFTFTNIIRYGVFSASFGPAYSSVWDLQRALGLDVSTPTFPGYVRWDVPIDSISVGGAFLVPIILSLLLLASRMVQKKHTTNFLSLVPILAGVTVLATVSYLFETTTIGIPIRHLLYVAPFISILAADGLHSLADYVEKEYRVKLPSRNLTLILVTSFWSYVYFVKLGSPDVNQIQPRILSMTTNLYDLVVFSAALCLVIFVPAIHYPTVLRVNSLGTLRWIKPYAFAIIALTIASTMVSIPTWGSALVGSQQSVTYQWNHYENNIQEVIDYYATNVHDQYSTVTFYGYALSYFGNRTIIEMHDTSGLASISQIMGKRDPLAISQFLTSNNIAYFLIPEPNHSLYGLFEQLRSSSTLFAMIQTSPMFDRIQTFQFFELYRFQGVLNRKLLLEEGFSEDLLGRDWTVQSGNWSVKNGLVDENVGPIESRILDDRTNLANFTLSVRVTFLQSLSGRLGIRFRVAYSGIAGYVLTIKYDGQTPVVADLKYGDSVLGPSISSISIDGVMPNQAETYTIEAYGDRINVRRNDFLIMKVIDEHSASGYIGFSTYLQGAQFSDLKVFEDSIIPSLPRSVEFDASRLPGIGVSSLQSVSRLAMVGAVLLATMMAIVNPHARAKAMLKKRAITKNPRSSVQRVLN